MQTGERAKKKKKENIKKKRPWTLKHITRDTTRDGCH